MNSVVRAIKIDREVTSADFHSAMRHLTGGVSVITVGRGREISGMTVTSVSSLLVDPPSLIVGINRSSSSWPLLKSCGFFGVNMLNADQLDVAERFTGKDGLKGAERFAVPSG
jgi:flavin reductase (DIM6/NTAB) family NADH-FMN oxidoreductase RutF